MRSNFEKHPLAVFEHLAILSFLDRDMQKAEKKRPASDGGSGPTAGNKLARPSLLFAKRKADKAIVVFTASDFRTRYAINKSFTG
jgi:hypothetical protein